MNNGNLLNGLLGITNANAAATKTATAKARGQSSEKFQQAFEQARPEVAARKPVSRKDNAATASPERVRAPQKPVAEPHKRAETKTSEAQAKVPADDEKSVARGAVPLGKSVSGADNDATTGAQTPVGEEQKLVEQGEDNTGLLDPALIDSSLVPITETAAILGELVGKDGALPPSDILNEENVPELLVVEGSLPFIDSLPGATPLASQHAIIDLAIGLPAQLGSMTINSQAATLQTSNSQLSTQPSSELLAGNVVDGLALDADATDSTTESQLTVDTESADAGDNPDFLLLNSKAAFNKLAEANMTSSPLDKSAPTAELAKPAVSPALESLTRLSEAQSPAARAFVVQTGVPATVGTPQWSQAVGDKVLWFAAQNVSAAEIRLDPPELGSLQVKVSVNQDQTSISFVSPHPAVREALDQQLHRLREMFSDQGLNLVNVDVSDKSFAQQQREQDDSAKNQGINELVDEELAPVAVTQAISMRLVDHYA